MVPGGRQFNVKININIYPLDCSNERFRRVSAADGIWSILICWSLGKFKYVDSLTSPEQVIVDIVDFTSPQLSIPAAHQYSLDWPDSAIQVLVGAPNTD